MHCEDQLRGRQPVHAERLVDGVDASLGRIGRNRRNLGHQDLARPLLDQNDIGESAADVDADPESARAIAARMCVRHWLPTPS